MKIKLSYHSIDRAKKRFNFNKYTLLKMCIKAVEFGKLSDSFVGEDRISYKYGHFNFIFANKEDCIKLVTITNLSALSKHKEKNQKPIYLKGKKTSKKMMIYRKESK